MPETNTAKLESLVWSVAEDLRGHYKQSEYGKVILPFVVLRRLDCQLEVSKEDVLSANENLPPDIDEASRDKILFAAAGQNLKVYNLSPFTLSSIKGQDPQHLLRNLNSYIQKFSRNVLDIFYDKFLFLDQLERLDETGILWKVFEQFTGINLHPQKVSTEDMGYLFENLIRRFSEISNETAGEHFTPREVIRLIVGLMIANDKAKLTKPGLIRQVYDPACGTGGMLALTEEALREFNNGIRVELYGQELNGESYAICKSDMLVTGHDPEQIAFGNTLTNDAHKDKKFHYMLCNPPYGVKWESYKEPILEEAKALGLNGRFGAGTPRISDGQLLFLQHMISKMRDDEDGSRIGIVMNGSPLFSGGAASGESEIRRWMLEHDWVEAIIALPTDLFYNTGIQTYVWLLTNRKPKSRRGKVQLIDASGERFWKPMRKSLGSKRREIPEEARDEIISIYADLLNGGSGESDVSKVFDVSDFGYRKIQVERPLKLNFQASEERISRLAEKKPFQKLDDSEQSKIYEVLNSMDSKLFSNRDDFTSALSRALKAEDAKVNASVKKAILEALSERCEDADLCADKHGEPEPDKELRDYERVPLNEDWREYIAQEVIPFVPDAWVDKSFRDQRDDKVGRVGYEINFNQYFYKYIPPRPLDEIEAEMRTLEAEIAGLLQEILQ